MSVHARLFRSAFAASSILSAAAHAQTAADGYSIYQFGTYKGVALAAPAPACATCHGPDPLNSLEPGLLNAAGNPSFLTSTAWPMAPMNAFDYPAKIDANGRQGIANYLLFPPAGTQPYSSFAAQSLDFGTVVIGQTMMKTMTLTNVGALALSNVVIQPSPSAAGVTETNDCPTSMAPQASCTVTVTFAPLAAGTANAGYVVSASNDANTGDTFFVFAAGATTAPPPPPPPPAASSGGGGALGFPIVGLGLLLTLAPSASQRRPASRKDR